MRSERCIFTSEVIRQFTELIRCGFADKKIQKLGMYKNEFSDVTCNDAVV